MQPVTINFTVVNEFHRSTDKHTYSLGYLTGLSKGEFFGKVGCSER